MRLLLLFPSVERGGAEEYALTIASAGVREGWEVHAAFPPTTGTASLIKDFVVNDVHYHPLKISESGNHYLEAKKRQVLQFSRTLTLLMKLKTDAVHITLPWPNRGLGCILACAVLKMPSAVVFQLAPHRLCFSKKRLIVCAWAQGRNQQWIAVSEDNRKFICKSFQIPPNEVLCIHNGYKMPPNSAVEDVSELRREVRNELGILPTSRILLTVGSLYLRKGYGDLVSIIPDIVNEFPDAKFVWIGEGGQRDLLFRKVREFGVENAVLFLGYRHDVTRFLRTADLFVFPTHFEGLPFSLIEAMAHGLPVIASNASSIPEVIEDKVHGLLFRQGDSCDLHENIRVALKHPDKMHKIAQSAFLRAKDFSVDKMANETLSVVKQLHMQA